MTYYHAIAILPGGRKKSIINKTEEQMMTEVVIPFESDRVVTASWGETRMYQAVDLMIYKTEKVWDKKSGENFEKFIGKGRNIFSRFQKRAKKAVLLKSYRVFIVMPIQGDRFGTQDDQRIFEEFDRRYEILETMLGKFKCVAIRIDKEHPMEDLVGRIKDEIRKAKFVIADLTDERPSCYFEAGYAEALGRQVIYVASKESVIRPKEKTKIHFDIHKNVNYFTNATELKAKVKSVIEKNRSLLFSKDESQTLKNN